jgi:hypothetical protein
MERLAKLNVIVSTNMVGHTGNYDAAVRSLVENRRNARRRCGKCSIIFWWSLSAAITADPIRTQRPQQPVRPTVLLRVTQQPRRTRARTTGENWWEALVIPARLTVSPVELSEGTRPRYPIN